MDEASVAAVPAVTLRSVSCPRCAGALRARDGDRVVECASCGTPFLIRAEGGFSRRYFPAKVERLQAVGRGAGWLAQHPDVPGDIEDSAFVEAQLLYVPIWEFRAHVVGWEFGHTLRTRGEVVGQGDQTVLRTELVDEPVETGFFGERRYYREGADLSLLGMGRPHITGRESTLPYLPGELERDAAVLQSDRELAAVQDDARAAFLHPPTGTLSRDTRLFLLKESAALLYYPLWSLRYRYRGRLYEMMVDGRTGEVHAARAPADNRRRIGLLLAAYAALAAALAVLLSAGMPAGTGWIVAACAVVVAAAVAVPVARRFRFVREVEYHEPFSS